MDFLFRLAVLASVVTAAAVASQLLKKYFNKPDLPYRFDREDVNVSGEGAMLVEFTSPYCIECQLALPVLEAAAEIHNAPLAVIDAGQRPDLTQKYSIRSTPTILVVDRRGKVTTGWKVSPTERDVVQALSAAGSLA